MAHHREHLRQHALALAAAAEQVAESAGDRSSATYLPAALACIEQTLDALSRGCQGAAHSLVPLDEPHEPVSRRFARAARDWPAARRGAGPSHERQVELLAALDEAGASLRAARSDCVRARELLIATMDDPAEAQGGPSLHAASAASG
jgi:hypothetical protein